MGETQKYCNFITISYFLCLFCIIFCPNISLAATIQLPQTGQTTCWDTNGNQISCAGTGQDGEFQMGVAWPDPRFIDNNDGTVTDKLTGLMWTKNANLANKSWTQALNYVASLNSGSGTYGYKDWRLPNVNELESLLNSGVPDNTVWLNNQGFNNVQANWYWTSTRDLWFSTYAWYFYMSSGAVMPGQEASSYPVWPVRSGQCGSSGGSVICLPKTGQTSSRYTGDDGALQMGVESPNPRFIDNDDGTVTDKLTGLMWTKNANLPGGVTNWQQALNFVKTISIGGYTDWRLSNKNEFKSLLDYQRCAPSLPLGHPFINVQASGSSDSSSGSWYWSSTTIAGSPGNAMVFIMIDGYNYNDSKSHSYSYVWPVRSGQLAISTTTTTTSISTTCNVGDIVQKFSTKYLSFAYDGTDLWGTNDGEYIYKVNRTDGTPITESAIQIPGSINLSGLAYDGTYFWAVSGKTELIYKINRSTKQVIATYPSGIPHCGNCLSAVGATWHDGYLYITDCYSTNKLYKYNSSGTFITSYTIPGTGPSGVAFVGDDVWITDWDRSTLYQSYEVTGGYQSKNQYTVALGWLSGIAFDGSYLWAGSFTDGCAKICIGDFISTSSTTTSITSGTSTMPATTTITPATTTISDNATSTTTSISESTTTSIYDPNITTTTTSGGGSVTTSIPDNVTTTTTTSQTTCTDNDADGYYLDGGECQPVDCNDNDAAVHPGAEETCDDGKDNDCDGKFDEDCGVDCQIEVMFPIQVRISDGFAMFFINIKGSGCPNGLALGNILSTTVEFVGPDDDKTSVTQVASFAVNTVVMGLLKVDKSAAPGVYYVYVKGKRIEVSGAAVNIVK